MTICSNFMEISFHERSFTHLMNTLKSGPSSDSADSDLFTFVSGGGAVMLRKESNPSASPKPVIAVSEPAADESPQTEERNVTFP